MADKKYAARRVIRGPDGRLMIIFIDLATGQRITDLTGYILYNGNNAELDTSNSVNNTNNSNQSSTSGIGASTNSSGSNYDWALESSRESAKAGITNPLGDLLNNFFGNIGEKLGLTSKNKKDTLETDISSISNTPPSDGTRPSDSTNGYNVDTDNSMSGLIPEDSSTPVTVPKSSGNVSGGTITVSGAVLAGVDKRLIDAITLAAQNSPYNVEVFSGKRNGSGGSMHDIGNALDVVLIDPQTGEKIANLGAGGEAFNIQEQFAKSVNDIAAQKYPNMKLRWGGYFSPSGLNPTGLDEMHYDVDSPNGMAFGDFENGLNDQGKVAVAKAGLGKIYSAAGTTNAKAPPSRNLYTTPAINDQTPIEQQTFDSGVATPKGVDLSLDPNLVRLVNDLNKATEILPTPEVMPKTVDEIAKSANDFVSGRQTNRASTPVTIANQNPETLSGNVVLPKDVTPQWVQDTLGIQGNATTQIQDQSMQTPQNIVAQGSASVDYDTAIKEAYLSALNYAEGSPKENQLFGYDVFSDMSKHPDTKVTYGNGEYASTAAGFLQINYPTWEEFAPKVGVTDFSLDSQKEVGWQIASDNYKNRTGRDLLSDLKSNDQQVVQNAFIMNSNRWSSLPGGTQERVTMNEVVSHFNDKSSKSFPTVEPDFSTIDGVPMPGEDIFKNGENKISNSGFMSDRTSVGKSDINVSAGATLSPMSQRTNDSRTKTSTTDTDYPLVKGDARGSAIADTPTRNPAGGFIKSNTTTPSTPTTTKSSPNVRGSTSAGVTASPSTTQRTSDIKTIKGTGFIV